MFTNVTEEHFISFDYNYFVNNKVQLISTYINYWPSLNDYCLLKTNRRKSFISIGKKTAGSGSLESKNQLIFDALKASDQTSHNVC
jgi:hypothetical protein